MTAATPATTAPKTTTRKPAPKCRSLRLLKWNPTHRLGVVQITDGKEVAIYSLVEIESGFADRAFRMAKTAVSCTEPVNIEAEYCVALEPQGSSCECWGHLRHGHKTVCRHVAAVKKLLELDLI